MSIEKSLERELAERLVNPLWEYVQTIPSDPLWSSLGNHRFQPDQFAGFKDALGNWKTEGSERLVDHRAWVTSQWSWAIADPETITFMVEWLAGRSVVEIGAGSGYWAYLLAQSGVDITCYDIAPIGHEDSWFHGAKSSRHVGKDEVEAPPKEWYPVNEGGPEVLALPENTDRVLFLCWPNYDTSFAYDAVKAYQGDFVIYIGEGDGGCNGDDKFWALMEGEADWWDAEDRAKAADRGDPRTLIRREWEEIEFHPMVQWSGLHDNLNIFKRLEEEA